MNTNNARDGVYLLDDADLKNVGSSVVGGASFAEWINIFDGMITIAGGVLAAYCWCIGPQSRQEYVDSLMNNLGRQAVADVVDEAGDVEMGQGHSGAAQVLGNAESVLENPQVNDADARVRARTLLVGNIPGACGS